jgi:hypothetical protein
VPTSVFLVATVTSIPAPPVSTPVTVTFFANTNRLGSKVVLWHNSVNPSSESGQARSDIVVPAGFEGATLIWSNAPAGTYALTARATASDATWVVSPATKLVILP